MKDFLYRHRAFLLPFLVLWIGVGYLQFFYSQNFIILTLNRYWTPFGDFFFAVTTHMGDAAFVISIALAALYYSYQKGILILAGYVLSGLLVQVSKIYLFPDSRRPVHVLEHVVPWLHTVANVPVYHNGSFPSGHTTTAFALFATVAFFSSSDWIKFVCLMLAVCVAYSRMYLLQHFLLDVHMGALLGTVTAVLLVYYLLSWWEARPRKWHTLGARDGIKRK
jgi:membrane-associated phospholipid phosphatase